MGTEKYKIGPSVWFSALKRKKKNKTNPKHQNNRTTSSMCFLLETVKHFSSAYCVCGAVRLLTCVVTFMWEKGYAMESAKHPQTTFPPPEVRNERNESCPRRTRVHFHPAILISGLLLPFPKTCLLKLLPHRPAQPPAERCSFGLWQRRGRGPEDCSGSGKACL